MNTVSLADVPMNVRPVAAADLAAVRRLLGQLGYSLSAEEVRRRLAAVCASTDHAVLIGDAAGEAVALLHLYVRPALEKPPEVIVQALVVDAGSRGGGVGKAMMAAAERWARQRGLTSVALTSHVKRTDAHAFYQALGYQPVATSHLLRREI